MTEVLNKIKKEYSTFSFHDGSIITSLSSKLTVNGAKVISCENELYYLTIHDQTLDGGLFIVVATEVNGPIYYVKKFSSVAGLRLYLASVMVMGI